MNMSLRPFDNRTFEERKETIRKASYVNHILRYCRKKNSNKKAVLFLEALNKKVA